MDKDNEYFKWLEYAENDFEAAEILSQQIKPKYEIVCYHCHQCAEKILKGYIASKNGKIQKTHDLVVLCESCGKYDPEFDTIIGNCSDLTIYASETRYPNTLEIEDYHMKKALKDTLKIRDFAKSKIVRK